LVAPDYQFSTSLEGQVGGVSMGGCSVVLVQILQIFLEKMRKNVKNCKKMLNYVKK
jgi:hypothetical protein